MFSCHNYDPYRLVDSRKTHTMSGVINATIDWFACLFLYYVDQMSIGQTVFDDKMWNHPQ